MVFKHSYVIMLAVEFNPHLVYSSDLQGSFGGIKLRVTSSVE